jgi:hypothetical protein
MNTLPVLYPKRKPSAARGFVPKFRPAVGRRDEFNQLIVHWSKKKVLTGMAVINGILYAVASKAGALSMDVKGDRHIHKGKLNQLMKRGCNYLLTTILGLSEYTKKYWKMAPNHRKAICAIRDDLHMLGLLKAVPNLPGQATKEGKPWSTFLDIDFAGLIVLYEILEFRLLKFWHVQFEELPEHKGALVKMLADGAKWLLGRAFGRDYPVDEGTAGTGEKVDPLEPVETEIEAENESVENAIKLVEKWTGDESGYDEEVYPELEASLSQNQILV